MLCAICRLCVMETREKNRSLCLVGVTMEPQALVPGHHLHQLEVTFPLLGSTESCTFLFFLCPLAHFSYFFCSHFCLLVAIVVNYPPSVITACPKLIKG